jgi:hypothetical protein
MTLRIAFVLRHFGYVPHVDPIVRGLLERGHTVLLRYEQPPRDARERAWLDDVAAHVGLEAAPFDPAAGDAWYRVRGFVHRAADYVRFLGPGFSERRALAEKASTLVNRGVEPVLRAVSGSSERLWSLLSSLIDGVERAVPASGSLERELRALAPDVLVLVPQLTLGQQQLEWARAARRNRIPTCLCIASWDHLTTKQRLRAVPERVVVWNEIQRLEAVELHGVPSDRVVITGAQSFDRWFEWIPRARPEFMQRVGLDATRPYIVYLGSALFLHDLTESDFVRAHWIPQLRADPRLADVGILVRPHPRRVAEWDIGALAKLDGVGVWPDGAEGMPIDAESRADFFDSLYHSSAAAGLNTTAMIEAAIVGRTVHTILLPEFVQSQTATLHFAYLVDVGGGILDVAQTWHAHRDSLARAVAGEDRSTVQRRRFLEAFVRPHGLDQPALGFVLDAIEETADATIG